MTTDSATAAADFHDWVFPPEGGVNEQIVDEFMSTGAVVAGRGTFEPAHSWQGDHHDGVPIWVLSRRPVPVWVESMPLVTYKNDIASAFREAARAAGDKDVLVHGAATAQRAMAPGLLDQIEIHLVPVGVGRFSQRPNDRAVRIRGP